MLKETTRSFLRDLGLFIQLPVLLFIPTLVVIIVFQEWFALRSFSIMVLISTALGQLLYRLNKPHTKTASGSSIVLITLIWFLIPVLGTIPYYGVALQGYNLQTGVFSDIHSAFFESMSGFTGTGLTMVKDPSQLPHVLQWWRSLSEWIGGLGVIFLAVVFLSTTHKNVKLYHAEAMNWMIDDATVGTTIKKIWSIYLMYTAVAILCFVLCGMPIWEAVNHGMVGIATGGFSITSDSFVSYSPLIKIVAIFIMIAGALSFKIHFLILVRRDFLRVRKQTELKWFLSLFVVLSVILLSVNPSSSLVDNLFQSASALATCGFNSVDVKSLPVPILFLILIPMLIGGNENSTTGGIKTSRLIWLVKSIHLSFLRKDAGYFSFNGKLVETDEAKTQRNLAGNLLFLYVAALIFGSLIILFLPGHNYALHQILFDVTSALSNVGLSSGLTGEDSLPAVKWVLVLLMWMGRLEIQGILILFAVLVTKKGLQNVGDD